mmetsp:Transcript_73486/g.153413  ORF Transcript_73486/g.153413 Transcript_73486/m.153413 type:complete len:295 (+) Transcript_73486:133-1017(+)|eukprot:CAMPEP_0181305202 /NCGR_PEP_ID=MMETSP1101-20121128/9592_1 /TAXON_ID=46948 /ORGANISM="Rhodomonas abbreviata, Strain Caron Lab Isolate" /LENGTH=294 /DNA_ID=CAMNT_0023411079 /DNA_START=121 /DNA_END=1005 /DNA_ORIENTATION=-
MGNRLCACFGGETSNISKLQGIEDGKAQKSQNSKLHEIGHVEDTGLARVSSAGSSGVPVGPGKESNEEVNSNLPGIQTKDQTSKCGPKTQSSIPSGAQGKTGAQGAHDQGVTKQSDNGNEQDDIYSLLAKVEDSLADKPKTSSQTTANAMPGSSSQQASSANGGDVEEGQRRHISNATTNKTSSQPPSSAMACKTSSQPPSSGIAGTAAKANASDGQGKLSLAFKKLDDPDKFPDEQVKPTQPFKLFDSQPDEVKTTEAFKLFDSQPDCDPEQKSSKKKSQKNKSKPKTKKVVC